MSKLIRGVFLALVLCVGLSAAAMAQAPAPQLRGFPTAEAAADASPQRSATTTTRR